MSDSASEQETAEKLVEDMNDEVRKEAMATLALLGAEQGELSPDKVAAFEAGVQAGYLCTLEMLMRRGFIPNGDE